MRVISFMILIFSYSFGVGLKAEVVGPQRTWVSPDFSVTLSRSTHRKNTSRDCRKNIASQVCLVGPGNEAGEPEDRPCLTGSTGYIPLFQALYDEYPPAFQRMFCSLRRIFVEKDFGATAYAGSVINANGVPQGAVVGIRQSIIDDSLTFSQWASWKEELSFGGDQAGYHITAGLPWVNGGSAKSHVDSRQFFLYYIFAHEFGHLFDFANRLNRCVAKLPGDSDCQAETGSWSALSWVTGSRVIAQNEFPGRTGLCFYSCNGNFPALGMVESLYQGFARSNFISTYASTNMHDDFAESVATYLADKYQGLFYELNDGRSKSYDVVQKLHSDLFRSKRQYIDDFFHRNDIVYP